MNECLPNHAQPSWRSAIGGDNGLYGTGWDWVVWSFEKARQYFPNSKLLINDYNILNNHWNNDLEILCDIVNILSSRGLIDGIGLQAHGLATTPGADVIARLNRITSRCPGVPIYISEFDLDIADDNQQRNKMAELFPIFWNNPAIHGITFWGYVQGHTWIPNSHLIRSDGSERPAMVWLKDYLDCSGGGNGTFNGVYSFVAQHSGKAIDTYNFGTSNGTNIVQWSYWGGDAQRFQVTHLGNGWHRISPVIATSQCIDVSGVSTASGANIHTWQYLGGNNQQWRFENAGNGNWKIIARHSGKCLDVEERSTADGANILQWDCVSGAQNQAFQVIQNTGARIASSETNIFSTESENTGFKIYPNPSISGDFTVDISSDDKAGYRITILGVDGKKVFETEKLSTGTHKINTGLKNGIYFIKTDGKRNFGIKKLIIM